MESYIAYDEAYRERHSLQIPDDSKNRDSLFGTYTYTPFILVCWEAVHTGTQASSTARYRNDLVLVVVVAVFVSHPGSKRRRRLTPPNSKSKSPQLKNLPEVARSRVMGSVDTVEAA